MSDLVDFYDIVLHIDWEKQEWKSVLYDVIIGYQPTNIIGSLEGDMIHINTQKIFIVRESYINDDLRGKGIGLSMYIKTFHKILNLGDYEIRSSTDRNDFSKGLWRALEKRYYNVKDNGKYHSIKRPVKSIL